MKRVTIDELREHLEEYLARVRAGETMLVCEEGAVPVRLTPSEESARNGSKSPLKAEKLLAQKPKPLPAGWLDDLPGIKPLRPVDVDALLAEERADRI